ncbi:MAG: PhoH family protein [Deltaproteobacteria bacterium]|nr:PhoH family protein [Deltaproteobacteria bacterium]
MQPFARPGPTEADVAADIEVADPDLLLKLSGPGGANLRVLENELGVSMGLRGSTIHIQGANRDVEMVERVLHELIDALQLRDLSPVEMARAARTLRANPQLRLRALLDDVVLTTSNRRIVSPKGVTQQNYIQAIRTHDIVFGIGPAGTGKTYLAMAMAIRALQERQVKRIILARPAVEAGERLGFLPGDLAEKINPYLRPLYDALHDMMEPGRITALVERGTIEVAPLAFMRGRTLNNCFVVLDEAQNTTAEQMKMFLTRLGFDAKAVITGDVTQIDLPGARSGLRHAERDLRSIRGINFVYFTHEDVVRHPLVQQIVQAYDAHESAGKSSDDDI